MQPLLPKLKKGDRNKVSIFNDAGVWGVRQHIELDNLSESLDVEHIDNKYFDIDCIPDMWARPLLFEMSLYDANHLLHERILGEWRGLLAMLALKERRNLTSLNVIPIEIPKPDSTATISQTSPDFPTALGQLAPSKTLSNDTSWHNLYVILFGNEPIGITSPTTLVCTASDYYNHIKNVTWFDGRFLFDPTLKLGTQEKKALTSWLEQLKNNLLKHKGLDQKMKEFEKLLGLINQFQDDLDGVPAELDDLSNSGLGMTGVTAGIFRHLDKPIKVKEVSLEKSYVLLKPSREKDPSPSLLVVDREIPGQWNIHDYEVFVWGSTILASFPFAGLGSNRTQFGSIQLPQDVRLRLPEDFFTEKLFVIDQQDAFPGTMSPHGANNLQYQGRPITPIIPIKDELLNYLTIDDLRQRVRFEPSNDGIVVKLRLLLSGPPDSNGKDFEVKREFRLQENEIILISNIPVLEIWPNFKASNWKAYYTYFSTAGQVNTFYAKPYTPGDMPEIQTFKNNHGEIERQISKMNLFPEAMICEAQVADTQTNMMKSISAGILFMNQPELLPPPTKTWAIGVDFGTTSTNVYASDGIRDPFPVHFESRLLKVTNASQENRDYYMLFDFLPDRLLSIPFLSFFHDLPKAESQNELRPLLDGHIFFLLNYGTFNDALERNSPPHRIRTTLKTNLKWGTSEERKYTRVFIEQLCLQCAAEAVADGAKEISWRYSFPTAFSLKQQEDFRKTWNQITKNCSEKTGLIQSDAEPKDEMESVVSALFFKNYHRAPFSVGTVCIDIGGGTSDISVWQDNELRWQASLRFAGRDIFLNTLHKKPNFLKIFGADVSNLNNTRGLIEFYAQSDALIRYEGEKWLKKLPELSERDNPELKGFIQLIAVGLSGLYYYVGLLLQYLNKSSRYEARMPNVYVAGNGSRMFHWLAGGGYDNRSPINALFKDVLLKASGFQGDPNMFDVQTSPKPKAEAAYGLVTSKSLNYNENSISDGVLSGEVFEENRTKMDWNEKLTVQRLEKGLQVPSKLEQLEKFLEVFDTYASSRNAVVSPIKRDSILMNKIVKGISQTLTDFRGTDEKEILVEPLFIVALKTFLEIKANDWANRNI